MNDWFKRKKRLYWFNSKAREIREMLSPLFIPILVYVILILWAITFNTCHD